MSGEIPSPPVKSCALFCEQTMRYVAAYLLAVLGGNSSPDKAAITKILGSIGLDIDDDKLDKVGEASDQLVGSLLCFDIGCQRVGREGYQ